MACLQILLKNSFLLLILCCVFLVDPVQSADASEPRIVNIYNFVRNSDYRVPHSEDVLY